MSACPPQPGIFGWRFQLPHCSICFLKVVFQSWEEEHGAGDKWGGGLAV